MKKNFKPLSVSLVYDDSLDGWEGVAQYVKVLGVWLQSRGHRVSYLAGQTKIKQFNGAPVYSLSKNIRVKFNGNSLQMPLFASSRRIKQALKIEQPDILHVQMPYSPLMAQKIINKAGTAAVVGTFHIYPAGRLVVAASKLLRLVYGRSLKRFNTVLSVSRPAQEFAGGAFGLESAIVPNMVDISSFLKTKAANQADNIVFLGRLVERKVCAYLIQAFAKVSRNNPVARLTIAGDGPQRQDLENLARQLGVADKVKFLGFINEADKPQLLRSAKIACFPSLYGESFGYVLVESMAAGAGAVIAGNNPGYAYVLENNHDVLFNPKDINGLAGKLESLLDEPARLEAIHKHQSSLVKKYGIENVGQQIEAIYYQAIANSRQTGDNNA